MKPYRRDGMRRAVRSWSRPWIGVIVLLAGFSAPVLTAEAQGWEPFDSASTLAVLTIDQTGQEHWSQFWFVMLDGQLYLRLGPRGAARVESNRNKPFVSIKIAGQRFDNVRVIPTPEMAERVAAAMAQKYWTDLIIHWFSHPLIVRLERGL